jgi:hypothetical protein
MASEGHSFDANKSLSFDGVYQGFWWIETFNISSSPSMRVLLPGLLNSSILIVTAAFENGCTINSVPYAIEHLPIEHVLLIPLPQTSSRYPPTHCYPGSRSPCSPPPYSASARPPQRNSSCYWGCSSRAGSKVERMGQTIDQMASGAQSAQSLEHQSRY